MIVFFIIFVIVGIILLLGHFVGHWFDKKDKFGDEKKKILLFCAAGSRSALSAKTLQNMGFNNVAHIDGGFGLMKAKGFKIVDKKKE